MITKKEARNIANWIFHESCMQTNNGTWITYASEIKDRYQYEERPIDPNKEDCETIAETIVKLYGIAILDYEVYEEADDIAIDINIGSWYYENDEDDEEEDGDECWDEAIQKELGKEQE